MTDDVLVPAGRRRRANRYLLTGAALTLAAILASLLGLLYTPYGPTHVDLLHRLALPSAAHLFGTDRFGRDVLSRVLAGGWRSLTLGFGATALGLALGLPVALATGYWRGRVDQVVMRFVDALLSIPTLVFALLIIVGLGAGQLQAILALGVASAPRFVRIVRGAVLEAASQDYVTAARARGERALYIQYGEILPNVWPPIIVEGSINVGFALMGGAALSYLGLGTQPPYADWGVM
ncbi:MAG: ABC transporter permease, partial [Alphaproteobacteria bacterium]